MKKVFIAGALLLVPAVAGAAGFAKQTLFLSKSSVTEGETVLIHASVSNDAATKFTGVLKLHDEDGVIGSVPISLAAGEADAVSVSWKPSAGLHTVIADLQDATGTVVEEQKETFSISPKPTPASTKPTPSTSAVEPSTQIQNSIAGVSPTAAEYSAPAFKAIDSGRVFAAQQLHNAIDWSKQRAGASAKPAPFKANSASGSGWANTAWTMFATVSLYILSVLLYVVSTPGVFYPVLAVIILYLVWKLFKRYRRA